MRDCQHAGRAHIGGLGLHIGERVVVWWCLVGWMEMVVAWGVADSVDVQTTNVGWALHSDVGGVVGPCRVLSCTWVATE